MGRIIDVSLPIGPGLVTWPGDPPFELVRTSRLEAGDPANVSQLRLGSHTGTHVDPPHHFLPGGDTIDMVPLEMLMGEAHVVVLDGFVGWIGPAELDSLALPDGVERLLLKTSSSLLWREPAPAFPEEYTALSEEGARWVVDRGIRLIGIDFLSIERDGPPDFPVHRTLLAGGVVIVEGLDLSEARRKVYELRCLPLRVVGGDGAPARAVLIER